MSLVIDQVPTISNGSGASVTSPSFTTTVASEIIIAMVTSDGFFGGKPTTFTMSSNGGLTWTLLIRNNFNDGTCEAWYATVSTIQTNLTVTASIGAGSSGDYCSLQIITLSGQNNSPIGTTGSTDILTASVTLSITTLANNSLVFAAFSRYATSVNDNTSTVVGSGQTKISEGALNTNHGDGTFWRQTNTTSPAGSVTSNLTTPSTDSGNIIAFEIVAAGSIAAPTYFDHSVSQPINFNTAIAV